MGNDNAQVSKEEVMKHLEMIQALVSRMSSNSFLLRGWSVTLVAGLFALAAKDSNPRLVIISYLPVCAFWLLDGYYLAQERSFRSLYNSVAAREGKVPPFSMDGALTRRPEDHWLAALFAWTLLIFHGALLITVAAVMLVFSFQGDTPQ